MYKNEIRGVSPVVTTCCYWDIEELSELDGCRVARDPAHLGPSPWPPTLDGTRDVDSKSKL